MSGMTGGSFRKVFYDLRPAKQVERRMLIDSFQLLMAGNFKIRDYQYTGMGSVFFVDFILLHRLLGLRRFLSAEVVIESEKRVQFNKPFKDIEIRMEPISAVLPHLDKDLQHILWLDYDGKLTADLLSDVVFAAQTLSAGSLLLVTIDTEPPTDEDDPDEWQKYYEREAHSFLGSGLTPADFSRSLLADRSAEAVYNAIRNGLSGRSSLKFRSLYKFKYADGHEMITVGGMLATDSHRTMLAGCDFSTATYLVSDEKAAFYTIRVPRLTRKERIYLDREMPATAAWKPKDFDLEPEDLAAFREVYRYYPIYGELLI
jgi:hypothetical protein